MTLEETYLYAEIISAAAVVASLIYLGIQIKQSRIQSENEAMDLITSRRSDFIEIIATDSELSYIIAKGLSSRKNLTPNEYFRFISYLYTVFVGLELGFDKWNRNRVNKEMWKAWEEVIHWWLQFPSVQYWWKSNVLNGYTSTFNKYVLKTIAELKEEPTAEFDKLIAFLEKAGNKSID
jgi:hypothetical protein